MEQPRMDDGDHGSATMLPSNANAAQDQQPHLQKRRSNAAMRRESHAQPMSSPGPGTALTRGRSTAGGRKGSIRSAVRKIFGRRSRDVSSQAFDAPATTSRHAYHKSEPVALSPPQELPELSAYPDEETAQPSFSDPYPAHLPSYSRTTSPYAVQFPNSVKLKPMDLGNPFMPRPAQSQLKRRKTLSSLVVAEREAAALAAQVAARESSTAQSGQATLHGSAPTRGTSKASKKEKRKSRSADDLKHAVRSGTPPRKRSEEIRYWRESLQPDVLRASGFRAKTLPEVESVADQVRNVRPIGQQEVAGQQESSVPPLLTNMDNFSLPSTAISRSGTFRSSPPVQHGRGKSGSTSLGDSDIVPSSSAFGTEMSRDLEDRVAKLEAGLHNFQRSLQRLTADRNRRTVIMGSVTTRQSSSDMRTPSLLADTLADPLDPASYQYSYEQTALRPSTSPQPAPEPQAQPPLPMARRSQAPLEDPFGPEPATTAPLKLTVPSDRPVDSFRMPSPLSSHPPNQQPPAPTSSSSTTIRNQPQPYTFSSLYQMLADERSARRKLERQLKGLRDEISQLAMMSNIQSERSSSYVLAGSSSKLQDLLRDTEENSSRPDTASQSPQRDSGLTTSGGNGAATHRQSTLAPIISRFSASESEAGAQEYDDLATPYEAYRTPREERSAYSLAPSQVEVDSGEGEMF